MVALLVVAVSATFLHASIRGRLDRATAGVLQGLAFAGIAIAAPFFAQLALLPAGEGSPYAVKKYAFGLITLLAVDLCVLVASLVPLSARLPRAQTVLSYVFGVALVVVATYGVFSQPGRGYFTTQMVDLERRVEAVTSSGDLGDDRRDYAVELVGSERLARLHVHGRNPTAARPRATGSLLPGQERSAAQVCGSASDDCRHPLRPSRLPELCSTGRARGCRRRVPRRRLPVRIDRRPQRLPCASGRRIIALDSCAADDGVCLGERVRRADLVEAPMDAVPGEPAALGWLSEMRRRGRRRPEL